MNKSTSVKGKARELVLDTAEQLFAEQGTEAVSLRAINAAAGLSPSVLHYHFGNREALVIAVVERRMGELMEQRQHLLQALLESKQPGITSIIEALVLPLANFSLQGGEQGQRYIRFMARLYADRSPILETVSQQFIDSTTHHFPTLIQAACPKLSMESILWRLNMANHTALQTLAELPAGPRPWQGKISGDQQAQVHNLISFISGGFSS